MIQFSKNSWHYQFYLFAYGSRDVNGWRRPFPTNLCPYFWKLVLAFLLMPIFLPLVAPMLILDSVIEDEDENLKEQGVISILVAGGILAWIVIFIIFCLLSCFFIWSPIEKGFWNTIRTVGYTFWGLGILVGGYYGVRALFQRIRKKNPKQHSDSLIGSFIKAKYNKYCPQINWK